MDNVISYLLGAITMGVLVVTLMGARRWYEQRRLGPTYAWFVSELKRLDHNPDTTIEMYAELNQRFCQLLHFVEEA